MIQPDELTPERELRAKAFALAECLNRLPPHMRLRYVGYLTAAAVEHGMAPEKAADAALHLAAMLRRKGMLA